MKSNPHPWFASGHPTPNFLESGYKPLSIDTVFGNDGRPNVTLGATLFGNAGGFDFSRLVQAAHAANSTSPVTDAHDEGPHTLAQTLDTPLIAEEPTQHLSYDREPDPGFTEGTLAQPLAVFGDTVVDLHDGTSRMVAHTLATPIVAEESAQPLLDGGNVELGWLQHAPSIVWLPVSSLDQPEAVIRPTDSAAIPVTGEPVTVIGSGPIAHGSFLYEVTSALAVAPDMHGPDISGFVAPIAVHGDAGVALASDLFVTDPAPLLDFSPDFGGVEFAAVLPHPIADPGPLV